MNMYSIFKIAVFISSILILINIITLWPPDYGSYPPYYDLEYDKMIFENNSNMIIIISRFPSGIYYSSQQYDVILVKDGDLRNLSQVTNMFYDYFIIITKINSEHPEESIVRAPVNIYLLSLILNFMIFIGSVIGYHIYKRLHYININRNRQP